MEADHAVLVSEAPRRLPALPRHRSHVWEEARHQHGIYQARLVRMLRVRLDGLMQRRRGRAGTPAVVAATPLAPPVPPVTIRQEPRVLQHLHAVRQLGHLALRPCAPSISQAHAALSSSQPEAEAECHWETNTAHASEFNHRTCASQHNPPQYCIASSTARPLLLPTHPQHCRPGGPLQCS